MQRYLRLCINLLNLRMIQLGGKANSNVSQKEFRPSSNVNCKQPITKHLCFLKLYAIFSVDPDHNIQNKGVTYDIGSLAQ